MKWHRIALKEADIIIANSKFVQNVARSYGVEAEVVYPFLMLENYAAKTGKKEYITLVTPCVRKGVEIFLKIADKLPNKKFLAVGWSEKTRELKKRKNIEYVPWVDDMRLIYSKTKILLVPSIWYEPFGRVVIEAMYNGIPCVVSNRGGLPEAVGNAGIIVDDVFNINAWIDSIKKLEADKNFYEELSKMSEKWAIRFVFDKQFKKLKKVLKKSRMFC
jgi:glycosyltransferase involved in cell wall biosynthesis